MFNKIIKLFNKSDNIYHIDHRISYSQEGEDLILKEMFNSVSNGLYVDVGAFHPTKYSNTKILYDLGWSGINIDPMPKSKETFDRERPRDINLEIGIGKQSHRKKFFIFEEPALNTFDESRAKFLIDSTSYRLTETRQIDIKSLNDVLKEYIKDNQHIDFISIDVENLELDVLEGNNWARYKPTVIMVEILKHTLADVSQGLIANYLGGKGYIPIAKTIRTVFFLDKDSDLFHTYFKN